MDSYFRRYSVINERYLYLTISDDSGLVKNPFNELFEKVLKDAVTIEIEILEMFMSHYEGENVKFKFVLDFAIENIIARVVNTMDDIQIFKDNEKIDIDTFFEEGLEERYITSFKITEEEF